MPLQRTALGLDAKTATPSVAKGSLTPSHIEQYSLGVIASHMKGERKGDDPEILKALVLRVQSGSEDW